MPTSAAPQTTFFFLKPFGSNDLFAIMKADGSRGPVDLQKSTSRISGCGHPRYRKRPPPAPPQTHRFYYNRKEKHETNGMNGSCGGEQE